MPQWKINGGCINRNFSVVGFRFISSRLSYLKRVPVVYFPLIFCGNREFSQSSVSDRIYQYHIPLVHHLSFTVSGSLFSSLCFLLDTFLFLHLLGSCVANVALHLKYGMKNMPVDIPEPL